MLDEMNKGQKYIHLRREQILRKNDFNTCKEMWISSAENKKFNNKAISAFQNTGKLVNHTIYFSSGSRIFKRQATIFKNGHNVFQKGFHWSYADTKPSDLIVRKKFFR